MQLRDTSVVVTVLTLEPRSHTIAEWIAAHAGELCVSAWLEPELSAALAAKQRIGEIEARARLSSLRLFDDMQDVVFIVADIERTDFEEAARMCDDPGLGLRAPDALHLSVALRLKLNLATLDRKQTRARAPRHRCYNPLTAPYRFSRAIRLEVSQRAPPMPCTSA